MLDDERRVSQSFSFGSRVYTIDDETTENGRQIVHDLNDQFEYIRRYMDSGPSAVPAPELVPTEISFRNSYRLWNRTGNEVLKEKNAVTTGLVRMMAPFAAFTALLHYIGMRTSREPVWPAGLDTGRASLAGA